jgi:hypothetical protein
MPKTAEFRHNDACDAFSIIDVSRVRVRMRASAREPRKKENVSHASFTKKINVLGFDHTALVGNNHCHISTRAGAAVAAINALLPDDRG